jgi:hypothetical protein
MVGEHLIDPRNLFADIQLAFRVVDVGHELLALRARQGRPGSGNIAHSAIWRKSGGLC